MANLQIANFSEFDELVGKVMFRAYVTGLSGDVQEANPDVLNSVEFLETYDYGTALRNLQERHAPSPYIGSNEQPQSTLFQVLGSTYRTESEIAAYRLTQDILDPHNGEANSRLGGRSMATPITAGSLHHASAKQSTSVETPIDPTSSHDLPKYTSILFLEAQKCGEVPQQTDLRSSYDPPQFKVVISFRGVKCAGVAQRKKMARHLAARAICQKLKISI